MKEIEADEFEKYKRDKRKLELKAKSIISEAAGLTVHQKAVLNGDVLEVATNENLGGSLRKIQVCRFSKYFFLYLRSGFSLSCQGSSSFVLPPRSRERHQDHW